MRHTKIVTVFLTNDNEFLILKRSDKVRTMKGLWAGISGIIENNEEPLKRAKTEVFEEVGIQEDKITVKKAAPKMRVISPQYKDHEWEIYPFLFYSKNPKITLNWENTDYRWIKPEEISEYSTVPSLEKVLFNLL